MTTIASTVSDPDVVPAVASDPTAVAARLLERLERAWNASDGTAFGHAFHDDSDFVDVRGGYHHGVGAIAAGHQGIFDSIYAGSTVRYRLQTARVVAPGCVLALAGARLDVPAGPLAGTHRSRLTAVITQADGRWRIAAFHNTLVAGS